MKHKGDSDSHVSDRDLFPTDEHARRIFKAVFGPQDPPDILIDRFKLAATQMREHGDPKHFARLGEQIDSGVDLEALELALRVGKKQALLTKSFYLMVALGETLPSLESRYVNHKSNFFLAVIKLAWAGIWTGIKLVKGLWIMKSSHYA